MKTGKHCLTSAFTCLFGGALIYCAVFIPITLYAQSAPAKVNSGLNQIVTDLEKAFPAIELYVIDRQDDKLLIENNKNSGLRPGLEFGLFREGKEFTHPITGVVLGHFEESLGDIKLIEIKEEHCVAQLINLKPDAEVKRGDKARIPSSRIKIAIWEAKTEGSAKIGDKLIDELIFDLEAGARFEALSTGEFAAGLDKLGIDKNLASFNKEQLQQLGQILGVRAVLLVQSKKLEAINILEARLFSTISGELIGQSSAELSTIVPASQPPIR